MSPPTGLAKRWKKIKKRCSFSSSDKLVRSKSFTEQVTRHHDITCTHSPLSGRGEPAEGGEGEEGEEGDGGGEVPHGGQQGRRQVPRTEGKDCSVELGSEEEEVHRQLVCVGSCSAQAAPHHREVGEGGQEAELQRCW